MDSFSKCVFVRAGKHTSVHYMHPHSNLHDSCKAVKTAISKRKSELMEQRVIDCESDQKKFISNILYLGVK